jgi:hypothetical protein
MSRRRKNKKNSAQHTMPYWHLPLFDLEKLTREEVLHLMKAYYPAGSGPLTEMRTICRLLANVAEAKGFEPFTQEEIRAQMDQEFYNRNESAQIDP